MGVLINLLLPLLMGGSSDEILEEGYRGAIFPHHLYVEDYMEKYYGVVGSESVELVILISPNHYSTGFARIAECSNRYNFDFAQEDCIAFKGEHGIGVHAPFLAKYFPNADVLPIIIKEGGRLEELDGLIAELRELIDEDVFVIASIDFTHVELESVAWSNDQRIMKWVEEFDGRLTFEESRGLANSVGEEGIAMDSPESFYVFFSLLKDANFEVFARTSSNSISGVDEAELNTSHIFVGSF